MLWACQNLMSFPEPMKAVWDQDPKMLEILMMVEEELDAEAKKQAERE